MYSILLECTPIVFVGAIFVMPGRPWDILVHFPQKTDSTPRPYFSLFRR